MYCILGGTLEEGSRETAPDPAETAAILQRCTDIAPELAGAEVIEINGQARVVASTWFGEDGTTLVVDGVPVSRPLTLSVIGDPHSLEEAARFRGGIVSEITGPKIGGDVQIDQSDDVVVTSLHGPPASQYARPATSGPTPR